MSYEQFSLVMKREHKTTMRDLMSSFRKIDLNGDGYITAQELQRVLIKVGPHAVTMVTMQLLLCFAHT